MEIVELINQIKNYYWNEDLGCFVPGMKPDICREIMRHLTEHQKLENLYETLLKQYDSLLKQDKSLQQYPKLFNDKIFERFTPEEVIEAAKENILHKSKGDTYEKV